MVNNYHVDVDEENLIPDKIKNYPVDLQKSIMKYIEQLGDKERVVYLIAKEHLGTSFDIVKSIGYINWKKSI
jgi:hypothetical protein